ncbi:MAG: cadherin-like domain-containing protein [Pseudomonadales bacterium]
MIRSCILICTLMTLGACGGGSGGSSAPPPPTTTSSALNDAATVNEDSSVQINVTSNDTNVTPSSAAIILTPASGTATINNGVVTYSPKSNFSGTDSLRYTVESNNNSGDNTATLILTINAVNDAPVAADDAISILMDTSVDLLVIENDTDVDDDNTSLTIQLLGGPVNGSIAVSPAGIVSYQPNAGFTGQDSFTYQAVDSSGALSNIAAVTVNVLAIGKSTLIVTDMTIPTTAYSTENSAEFDQLIQVSAPIEFEIGNDTVSFVVSLTGPSVLLLTSLIIIDVKDPQGIVLANLESIFCDLGLCTIQVPKRPGIEATVGTWSMRLGTMASNISQVDLASYRLQIAQRIGEIPDPESRIRLAVKPFLTGLQSPAVFEEILNTLSEMADRNNIELAIDPLIIIDEFRFTEVSSDFQDADTVDLVRMGDPDKINVFFIEGFSVPGGAGLLGIAGGIPGSLGIVTEYNGVLVSGTATENLNTNIHRRTTAEFTLHEMNHLMGLFHTTESEFTSHDILVDTVECIKADHDLPPLGQADADECPDGLNPMFWENDLFREKTDLTPDQRAVLRRALLGDL